MDDKRVFLEELALEFDLNRIRELALPEKFKLVNHIKLIYTEARRAAEYGIKSLEKSENFTVNKTYSLFALLLIDDLPTDFIGDVVTNYARHFEKSDTYYAQVAVLGMGVMLIQKGFAPDATLNFLMNLLGDDFLAENLKYKGRMTDEEAAQFEFEKDIVYKPFEGNMRLVKYNLLALLKLRDTQGMDVVRKTIAGFTVDNRFKMYFNLMDVTEPDVMDFIYEELMQAERTELRLKVYGAYAILKGFGIHPTHYMFNSIIGKYSRFDKDSSEIEDEMNLRLEEILTKG